MGARAARDRARGRADPPRLGGAQGSGARARDRVRRARGRARPRLARTTQDRRRPPQGAAVAELQLAERDLALRGVKRLAAGLFATISCVIALPFTCQSESSRSWLLQPLAQTSFALLLLRLSRTCRSRSKECADVSPPRVSPAPLLGSRLLALPLRRLQGRRADRESRLGRGGSVRRAARSTR